MNTVYRGEKKMFTNEQWEERLRRQEELEEFAHLSGHDRFYRRLDKAQEGGIGSTAGAARKLLVEAVEPTEKAIQWAIEDAEAKRGRKPAALRWVRELGTDVAAFLTARVVLDGIHTDKQDAKSVARHLSLLILHELRYRRFREQAPGLFHYRMANFQTNSYAHRSRSLNAAMSYAEIDVSDLEMEQRERILVGMWLIDKFAQATGLIELETEATKERGKAVNRLWIVPAPGTLEWMAQRNEVLADLQPLKLPMLVPALPWRAGDRGGYRFKLRGAFPLVRGYHGQADAVEGREMPIVYDALNRLQDTAWQINQDVLAMVREIEARGGGLCGIPEQDLEPEPTLWDTYVAMRAEGELGDVKVVDGEPEGPEDQVKDLLRRHRYTVGRVKERNHYRKLEQLAYRRLMSVVERFENEVFFYAYNLDFRGRIYPIVDYLSPQGPDIEKALLTFADKRPMGALGGKWLALHLTGSMGVTPGGTRVSTMTLIERQAWVEDNEDRILQVARDPWADLWWTDTDDPLQVYAACCEWARWAETDYSSDYLCGLPVAMDGSCNGLQHFAAMFRDEVGAKPVNVTPNDRPLDVYSQVADKVLDRLEAEAFDNPLAKLWLTSGLVDRSLTKRPTMTFGYGSKPFGFTSQIVEYLEKNTDWEATQKHFSTVDEETGEVKDLVFEAAGYIAKVIWDALGDVVVKAFEAMEWLQRCARAVASEGKPVEWTVPLTGFRVVQSYWEMSRKKVETILAGKLVAPRYHEPTDKVAAHKQANAIAPNVVHSLDAAALMLTVQAASEEGIEAFGMVHDSYATVPGDAELLAEILRQEFVRLYQEDVPALLREQWQEQVDEAEIPEPPRPGSLDLSGVLVSDYFFA